MENPILVEVHRGEIVESFHRGVICVVDENNELLFSMGDIHQMCYPRSSMKFLQHIPLLESGAVLKYGFTLKEIAVMCGSHNSEKMHLETVASILSKIGLSELDLKCGAHLPTLSEDIKDMYQIDKKPTDIYNNCSGKHAGFLAYCMFYNVDTDDYLNPNHPLQQQIKKVCAEMYEVSEESMLAAIDGCSAPVYSVSVLHQAIGYKNLAATYNFSDARKQACALIIEAVKSYPEMVAGTNRYCTDMMRICGDEIVGKTGAEGVYCMSLYNKKIGVCIKIDDGKMLPQYNVAQAIIESLSLFSSEKLTPLHKYLQEDILNWNHLKTGVLKPSVLLLTELNRQFI